MLQKTGTEVDAGEPLALIYAADDQKRETLAKKASLVIKTTTAPVLQEPSMIIDVWT
jgi:thymidine phosphorylase